MMQIAKETGLIVGVNFLPSPNYDERPDEHDISLIVVHNISLPPEQFGSDHINQLFTNSLCAEEHPFFAEITHLRVSSHVLIRRDGEVIQYVPFHKRAWHAGVSSYQGREVCNDFSIGIELEGSDNQPFSDQQYDSLCRLVSALQVTYQGLLVDAVTGHEHIAPGRKTDPGPYFEWDRVGGVLGAELPASADKVCS